MKQRELKLKKLTIRGQFKCGRLDGLVEWYNGQVLVCMGKYIKGIRSGFWKFFDSEGILTDEKYYQKGKVVVMS